MAEQVERWTLEQTLVIGEAMDEERGLTRVGSVAGDRLPYLVRYDFVRPD